MFAAANGSKGPDDFSGKGFKGCPELFFDGVNGFKGPDVFKGKDFKRGADDVNSSFKGHHVLFKGKGFKGSECFAKGKGFPECLGFKGPAFFKGKGFKGGPECFVNGFKGFKGFKGEFGGNFFGGPVEILDEIVVIDDGDPIETPGDGVVAPTTVETGGLDRAVVAEAPPDEPAGGPEPAGDERGVKRKPEFPRPIKSQKKALKVLSRSFVTRRRGTMTIHPS